jgi:hypothetical protein
VQFLLSTLIENVLPQLGKSMVLFALDLQSIFWQIKMVLGHSVDAARIKPHQSKVVARQGFLIFATPTNVKAS